MIILLCLFQASSSFSSCSATRPSPPLSSPAPFPSSYSSHFPSVSTAASIVILFSSLFFSICSSSSQCPCLPFVFPFSFLLVFVLIFHFLFLFGCLGIPRLHVVRPNQNIALHFWAPAKKPCGGGGCGDDGSSRGGGGGGGGRGSDRGACDTECVCLSIQRERRAQRLGPRGGVRLN